MHYKQYILKRKLENIFIAPFIVLGKMVHLLKGHKKQYDYYFFFPFYHLGGAEKIHLQIAQLAKGKKALIVFTRFSNNEGFLNEFKQIEIDIEIASAYTNNNILRLPLNLIARGFYAARVNKDHAKVFNGQSNFGYKISPWIADSVHQFELIHSYNSFSWIRIPFAQYYRKSVMISQNKIQEHCAQYEKIQAPSYLKERIVYIPNAIAPISNIVEGRLTKKWTAPFKVLYVGRGSEEKRIPEIITVAKKAKENKLPFEFELIGDVADFIPADASNFVTLAGMINDKEILNAKYQAAHFIILLSSTEGMPLVILEAMQNGCIPIVTAVGDLPLVINKDTGFLLQNNNESVIVDTYESLVTIAKMQSEQLETLSKQSVALVAQKYSMEQFNDAYQQLLDL
jgi:glycosyltransferase involved in cell wall biosynthesis